ncbi:MAG: hypothetical protein NTZ65_04010 [Candidatus Berkelbacteria bacterium]|nr:hypothetical protein [Candidatus Berkelbacteria bacterium]
MRKEVNAVTIGILSILIVGGMASLALKYKIFADSETMGLNPNIKLSQISTFVNPDIKNGSVDANVGDKKPIGTVEINVPRNESKSFSVLLENQSASSINDLTLKKSDLTGVGAQSSSKISQNLIDDRVVHKWTQKTINWYTDKPSDDNNNVNVDELLVKNDKTDFFSTKIGTSVNSLLTSGGSVQGFFSSPNGSAEKIQTSVAQAQSKKFFFTLEPSAADAGQYQAPVSFVDKDKNTIIAQFNLKVNILDIDLVKPSQAKTPLNYGCFTNDRISIGKDPSARSDTYISKDLFEKRLKIIKNQGCESLILRFGPDADNLAALELISNYGFAGPVILNYYYPDDSINKYRQDPIASSDSQAAFKNIVNQIQNDKKISIPIMFYGYDEPNSDTEYPLAVTRTNNIIKIVKEVLGSNLSKSNAKANVTMASQPKIADQLTQENFGFKMDMTIEDYSKPGFLKRVDNFNSGSLTPLSGQSYYFQGWQALPLTDRYLGGLALIKSGYRGAFMNVIYGYQNANVRPIYDDSQITTWQAQFLTYYPASDGFIPTLESEGLREGNLDLKYYLTYLDRKEKIQSQCPEVASQFSSLEQSIQSQMNKYTIDTNQYTVPANLSPADFDKTRSLLEQYVIDFNSRCVTRKVDITSGFSVIGADGSAPSQAVVQGDMTGLAFEGDKVNLSGKKGDWTKTSSGQFELNPGQAYYLFEPLNSGAKQVQFSVDPTSTLSRPLTLGWNLLWSPYNTVLGQINTVITNPSKTCKKIVNLQALTTLKAASNGDYASRLVYVITNDKAQLAKDAFKILGYSITQSTYPYIEKIPANTAFWYYIFQTPNADDAAFNNITCQ